MVFTSWFKTTNLKLSINRFAVPSNSNRNQWWSRKHSIPVYTVRRPFVLELAFQGKFHHFCEAHIVVYWIPDKNTCHRYSSRAVSELHGRPVEVYNQHDEGRPWEALFYNTGSLGNLIFPLNYLNRIDELDNTCTIIRSSLSSSSLS